MRKELSPLLATLTSKSNEVTNLKDIDKAAWNFILAIYKLRQNSLITDNNKTSFRNKILSKITSKVNKVKANKSKSSKDADKPAAFNKLPSLILVKSYKDINKKEESLTLIYIMTLEESFVFERFLEKVVQFG